MGIVSQLSKGNAVGFGVEIGEYRGRGSGSAARLPAATTGAAHPRAVRRGVLSPADPVREHCRTEDPSAAVDPGRERRDQRAGPAREFPGRPAPKPRTVEMITVINNPEHSDGRGVSYRTGRFTSD